MAAASPIEVPGYRNELRQKDGSEYPPLRVYRDEVYERATEDFFESNIKRALLNAKGLILIRHARRP